MRAYCGRYNESISLHSYGVWVIGPERRNQIVERSKIQIDANKRASGKTIAMLEKFYTAFEKTVNILAVDDSPAHLEMVEALFDSFGIYKVTTAGSATAARERIAGSDSRFHACVLDLGINDIDKNEFFLLETFGRSIPFVMMSGRQDVDKVFECGKRGAKAFAPKATMEFSTKLISSVNKNALLNMICPGYRGDEQTLVAKSVEILITANPINVNEWARQTDVPARLIHREWKERLGISPLHALTVFHLYSGLFAEIQNTIASVAPGKPFRLEDACATLLRSNAYRRKFEYYLANKQRMLRYITTPAIAS